MIATPVRMKLKLPARETDLETWAREEIEKAGGWMVKWVAPSRRGPPDDICFWFHPHARRGFKKVIDFLEFKLQDTEPDELQLDFHARLRAMGHEVLIPRDRAWILEYIERRRVKSEV
jgi:hypothetical protein